MATKRLTVPEFLKDPLQSALEPLGKVEARAKELLDKIRNDAPVNQADFKKAISDILKRVKDARTEVEKSFNEGVQKTLSLLNLPTREDLKKIEAKVNRLAKEVSALKPKKAAKKKTKKR